MFPTKSCSRYGGKNGKLGNAGLGLLGPERISSSLLCPSEHYASGVVVQFEPRLYKSNSGHTANRVYGTPFNHRCNCLGSPIDRRAVHNLILRFSNLGQKYIYQLT